MLIAQLDPGAGDSLIAQTVERQRQHPAHHDALDEPSAQLSAPDLSHGDPTSLFSFSVGPQGHPFHCHAGHRVFTAITGSGGAQLRFSTASLQQLDADPNAFVRALRYVNLPGDSLFTVRFGGGTWHQFAPAQSNAAHSAFFALSCHPDEAGGVLSDAQQTLVHQGQATIASLTELLPAAVTALLQAAPPAAADVPTVSLSLHASPESWQQRACSRARRWSGRLRQALTRARRPGFVATHLPLPQVSPLPALPPEALLHGQLGSAVHFQDGHQLELDARQLHSDTLQGVLCDLLQAFVDQPPRGVSGLMQLRNLLVAPLGWRTSRRGCPVSPLLDPSATHLFAGRFPVLAQRSDADGQQIQVVLGADDKHLRFRSLIALRRIGDQRIALTMATQVSCRNWLGRVYIASILHVHHHYIVPAMLRAAAQRLLHAEHAESAAWLAHSP
ncbi:MULTISPECIES: DUF2867 domain-containing protein [Xanthomonas]|uniref:DUF2867 domain-containing protein n=1 Tax=Xanthomonas cucurbitae TaxID=56453 RepID=A0A2S7DPX4_9XANT|nr:DUF2867 domain-containing protein [Xanthomonas cucurbitae]PPU75873.1 hypothetical protein XcuCFBP2542_12605 [Xanthomonas cucurbitae]QHG89115.1 DUF2867 domain-containing protein [Xanthomonas cucurbitae]WDM69783.1 DUF2867 domain-containing protein [Xanthomonas cucurbitae]WDM73655.1 DUF2867 domain-containing protein [Xanthomonas cucurbitae]WDM77379.1 DUF2867 domain-containing protein [Xanthomonas cucurbitae]